MSVTDVYSLIEESVISQLQNGIIPWHRPYKVNELNEAISHKSQMPYSFINQCLLNEPGEYWTFEQIASSRHKLRKGSRAKKIVFWKIIDKVHKCKPNNDLPEVEHLPLLKWYNVFHESDIEDLTFESNERQEEIDKRNAEFITSADQIIDEYFDRNKDILLYVAERKVPCFSPGENKIFIPRKWQFDNINQYYSTLFHEIVHSTRDKLDRKSLDYSNEELVAEIGSAFLCKKAGIESKDIIEDHSAYCAYWIGRLKGNMRCLVQASSKAEKAVRYILNKDQKDDVL